jgi:hypothetical protein
VGVQQSARMHIGDMPALFSCSYQHRSAFGGVRDGMVDEACRGVQEEAGARNAEAESRGRSNSPSPQSMNNTHRMTTISGFRTSGSTRGKLIRLRWTVHRCSWVKYVEVDADQILAKRECCNLVSNVTGCEMPGSTATITRHQLPDDQQG